MINIYVSDADKEQSKLFMKAVSNTLVNMGLNGSVNYYPGEIDDDENPSPDIDAYNEQVSGISNPLTELQSSYINTKKIDDEALKDSAEGSHDHEADKNPIRHTGKETSATDSETPVSYQKLLDIIYDYLCMDINAREAMAEVGLNEFGFAHALEKIMSIHTHIKAKGMRSWF